jgi:DNA polymerase III epsilon subunit family exonuclease
MPSAIDGRFIFIRTFPAKPTPILFGDSNRLTVRRLAMVRRLPSSSTDQCFSAGAVAYHSYVSLKPIKLKLCYTIFMTSIFGWLRKKQPSSAPVVRPVTASEPSGKITHSMIKTDDLSNYVVLDLETTGLYPETQKIIEIAAIKIVDGKVAGSFSSLIHYPKKLSPAITDLTGITTEDLKNAPDCKQVLADFQEFAKDFILVGHNISQFDNKFLWFNSISVGLDPMKNQLIDTLNISRQYYDFSSHKLSSLSAEFNIPVKNLHRASDDAILTAKIFDRMKRDVSALQLEVMDYAPSNHFGQTLKANGKYLVDETGGGDNIPELTDKKFCVTTFMPFAQFEQEIDLQRFIVNHGGTVSNNLTLKVDYLIDCNPDYVSDKEKRAIENVKNGKATTKIITPDEFLTLAHIA